MRKLVFEKLDRRWCMAFGDVVADFAGTGEYTVSYNDLDKQRTSFVENFVHGDGILHVANSYVGSGFVFTLAKTDSRGTPDLRFGNGGLIQFSDPAVPQAWIQRAIELADGSLILRAASIATTSLIKLQPNGALDTSFGDEGFVRMPTIRTESEIVLMSDRLGGFYLLTSSTQSFQSTLTHYLGSGELDVAFGNQGVVSLPRLRLPQMAVSTDGKVTILAIDSSSSTSDFITLRFLNTGILDSQFGNSGVARLSKSSLYSRLELLDNGDRLLIADPIVLQGVPGTSLRRYSSQFEPDTSFGDAGTATIAFATRAFTTGSSPLQVDATGITLLRSEIQFFPTRKTELQIARLTLDGQLDTAFGLNGFQSHTLNDVYNVEAVRPDGQGGFLWDGVVQPFVNANYYFDSFIVRTLVDGSLDTTWGQNGIDIRRYTPVVQRLDMLQLDPLNAGRVRVTSGFPHFNSPNPTLGRSNTLDAQGQAVASSAFGTLASKMYTVSAPAANGGWYIAQIIGNGQATNIEISAFHSDGSLNTDFGAGGVRKVATDNMATIFMRTSRDGSVVVGAGSYSNQADPAVSQGVAVLIRLRADGSLDENFAPGGVKRFYEKPGNVADVLVDPNLGTVLVLDPFDQGGVEMWAFNSNGSPNTRFGNNGIMKIEDYLDWRDGQIDELGRIVMVTQEPESSEVYRLYQFDNLGQPVSGFGSGGSVLLPVTYNAALDSVSLSVRRGVITVAAVQDIYSNLVRLMAFDYAGKPLIELNGDGVRDYDLSRDGAIVSDLDFADDGSLWLATSQRRGFNQIGSVIKLEGSQTPTAHNWTKATDVTGDGNVTALDALIVISAINGLPLESGMRPDTNADTNVSAIDALLVINEINAATVQMLTTGEGEADYTQAIVPPANSTQNSSTNALMTMDAHSDIVPHKRRC